MSIFTVRYNDDQIPNLTYDQAITAREQDIERLRHAHLIEWEWALGEKGPQVRWRCTCRPDISYNAAAVDAHIRDAIRAERGPKK